MFRLLFRLFFSAVIVASPALAAPEQWKHEIDALLAQDAIQPPPEHAVLFVGSSSIRLWTSLAEDFPNIAVINHGFGGSELADSVYYADKIVIPYNPRAVVIYAGDNDLNAGKSPEQVAADFAAFRTKLHATLPATQLFYLSVKLCASRAQVYAQVRKANKLIAADCAAHAHCAFVDVATPLLDADGKPRPELFRPDQLHLSPAGYTIWKTVLSPLLRP